MSCGHVPRMFIIVPLLLAAVLVVPPASMADQGGELGGLILIVYPEQTTQSMGPNQTVPFTVYVQEQVSLNNTTIYWTIDGNLSSAYTNLQVMNFVGAEHATGHHSVRVIVLYGNGTDYFEWDVNVTGASRSFTITGSNPGSTMQQIEEGGTIPMTITVGDPDGQITGYRWSIDGMRQVGANGKLFNYVTGLDDSGVHEIKVEVVGRTVGSQEDLILDHVWLVDVAERLVCSPSNDTVQVPEGGRIDFLVGDPTFGPGEVEWRLDGNIVMAGARFVYYPDPTASGAHQVTVVTPIATRTWDVFVSNVPRSPIVKAVPYIETKAGSTVLLQLNVSDEDNTIAVYMWDTDGDGVTDQSGGTMSSVEVKFGKAGDTAVTARVIDSTGNTQTLVTLVHVRPKVVDMTPYHLMAALACVMVLLLAAWGALAYKRKKRAEKEALLRAEDKRKDELRKKALQVLAMDEAADADGTTSFVELPDLEEKGGEGEAAVDDWEVEKGDRGEALEEFEGLRDAEPDTIHMKPYASRLKDRGMGGEVEGDEGTEMTVKGKETWTAEIRRAKAAGDKKEKQAAFKRELDDIVTTLAKGKQVKEGEAPEGGARKGHAKAADTEVESPDGDEIAMAPKQVRHKHVISGKKRKKEGERERERGRGDARPSMKRKDSDAIIERRRERKGDGDATDADE